MLKVAPDPIHIPWHCFPMEILGFLPNVSFEGECLVQNAAYVALSTKPIM